MVTPRGLLKQYTKKNPLQESLSTCRGSNWNNTKGWVFGGSPSNSAGVSSWLTLAVLQGFQLKQHKRLSI